MNDIINIVSHQSYIIPQQKYQSSKIDLSIPSNSPIISLKCSLFPSSLKSFCLYDIHAHIFDCFDVKVVVVGIHMMEKNFNKSKWKDISNIIIILHSVLTNIILNWSTLFILLNQIILNSIVYNAGGSIWRWSCKWNVLFWCR